MGSARILAIMIYHLTTNFSPGAQDVSDPTAKAAKSVIYNL